ncbi:MAG: SLBB domain-containing protein [Bacteroidota bacterium]
MESTDFNMETTDFQKMNRGIMKDTTDVSTFPAYEGIINPDFYFLGPSDVLSVNIWISPPFSFNPAVTPEGMLLVPTVGEVYVAGLTLTQAKKKIISEIQKKYLSGKPTVTLMRPRKVIVTVDGSVVPYKVTLYATQRIEAALRAAKVSINIRNIIVKRLDHSEQRVDVLKFYATKDEQWNPYVREGDEIVVPRIDGNKNTIAIFGGVQVQGMYDYVEGDTFLDIIALAHGFTRRARQDSILLYRYDSTGSRVYSSVIDANAIKGGRAENIPLMRFDKIVVQEQYEPKESYHVTVKGEVIYPGVYPIEREKTHLSAILKLAGGFTQYAAISNAEVQREIVSPPKYEKTLNFRGLSYDDDSLNYNAESELLRTHQVASVDFKKLIFDKDTSEDIVLFPGDTIVIPSSMNNVYVFGQVVTTGNVPYISGKDFEYYLQRAGGVTDAARTGDIMIIKHTTRQWMKPDETKIEENDYIWVPKKMGRPFAYYLNIVSQVAGILGTTATFVLLAIQLK